MIKKLTLAASLSTATLFAAPTPLFNGKDLTGWKGKGYIVEDGAITCTPQGRNLMTEKEYTNYVFEFEFKLPPAGNNGIGIHYPGKGDAAYAGMEIQILDDSSPKYKNLKEYQFHGSLYTLQAAKKGFLKPVGKWNKETITVNGDIVTVELNGTLINRANLADLAASHPKHEGVQRRSGFIAFCGHGDRVQYKNISIDEIQKPAPKPPAPADEVTAPESGYTKIYNGKDLTGWLHGAGDLAHWQPQGEVIHYDGKSQAKEKNLWTEKEYGDTTLYVDWRWAGPASHKANRPLLDPLTGDTKIDENGKPIILKVDELDSGIYLRGNNRSQVNLWNWPGGSGEVYGYRTNKNHPQAIRAALTPKVKADKPIGEWNRMAITLKGDRLTVVLNDQIVIENAQLPGVPPKGRIALQHHGSELEFANIYIKEL